MLQYYIREAFKMLSVLVYTYFHFNKGIWIRAYNIYSYTVFDIIDNRNAPPLTDRYHQTVYASTRQVHGPDVYLF